MRPIRPVGKLCDKMAGVDACHLNTAVLQALMKSSSDLLASL